MINIQNLKMKYRKNLVLDGINLEISDSKITAIAGPNGSGKTTLIKSILGLVKIQSGSILINNKNIINDYHYRKMIGYMPQIGRYPENLTIQEVFSMIQDLTESKDQIKIKELIELFEVEPFLQKQMKALSGGTKQKVSAIIAFMNDYDILILDEPTTGLDPISASRLKDLIQEKKNSGKTILLISHIMAEVEELADELVYLLDGKIYLKDTISNLTLNQQNLERAIANKIRLN